MHSITLTSRTALAFAESVPVQLFRKTARGPTPTTHEEATKLIGAGNGANLHVEVTAENVGALLDKVQAYQTAYDILEVDAEAIARRVSSARAEFIRSMTADLVVAAVCADSGPDSALAEGVIKGAVRTAAKVDEALWTFLDEEEEG